MGNISFNASRARVGYYASLPATSDALILVPIEATGLETDATLQGYATLAALLAASNNEQTTMGRKTLTGVTLDETANPATIDAADVTWASATGNAVGAVVLCYVPDTGTSTDANMVPLAKYDYVVTPSGVSLPATINNLITVS
jgi:hypothetical protein